MVFAFTSCEEIYTPVIESRESIIVADARIVDGFPDNVIKLYESKGFNDEGYAYPNISGASVYIVDNKGNEIKIDESTDGIFPVKVILDRELEYKLKIIHKGNNYESSFEPVPKIPDIDTVYGIAETEYVKQSGNNNVDEIIEVSGVRLYTNITHENEQPFYKFTARKVLQYTYLVEVRVMGEITYETMFAWLSSYPRDLFNIASPPEYSSTTNIIKHPLFFLEKSVTPGYDQNFDGWILILHQYGLSESAYNYYKDLNNQLGSEGRLFDPLYVQARSNLKCTSDSEKLILGNFEISSHKEHRYYVKFISNELGYLVRPITYFYEIPESGEQMTYPPDFWEYNGKHYPNE